MSESEQNQEKSGKSHWRSLAELLGARSAEEQETVVGQPASETEATPTEPPAAVEPPEVVEPPAATIPPEVVEPPKVVEAAPEKPKSSPARPASNWFALASELGIPLRDLEATVGSIRIIPEQSLPRVSHLIERMADTFSEIGQERLELLSRLQHISEMSQV